MQSFDTLVLESIRQFDLSDGGEFMLVHGSPPWPVAFHHSVLPALLAGTASAIGTAARVRSGNRHSRFTMHSESWEVGTNEADQTVYISFCLKGQAELSFYLPRQQIAHLIDVLSVASGAMPRIIAPNNALQ